MNAYRFDFSRGSEERRTGSESPMDWESKEPPSFKIPRLELEIAAMGKEKGVGGGEEIKLGFEQTVAGYIKNRALSEVPMEGQNFR